MVDAAYEDLYEFLRPGVARTKPSVWSPRRSMTSAPSTSRASTRSPVSVLAAPARVLGSADPSGGPGVLRHPAQHKGYRTCYYRTFAVGRPVRRNATRTCGPGSTWTVRSRWSSPARPRPTSSRSGRPPRSSASPTRRPRSPSVRPRRGAVDLGEADLLPVDLARPPGDAQGGHGLRAGDLLAVGGRLGAARIEEEIVVTADGCEVITKFPRRELWSRAGKRYFTVGGPLNPCEAHSRTSTPQPVAGKPRISP